MSVSRHAASLLIVVAALVGACRSAPEPPRAVARLGAWSDGPVKERILAFVDTVSDPSHEAYVPPARRIAVFDLDGTLIIERPLHLEVLVAMEKLRADMTADPSLAERELYQAVLVGDVDYIRKHGADIVAAAADGGSVETFRQRVRSILANRHHPSLERSYSALFYAPMLELVELLETLEFRVYVVSQSQQEYIRAFAESCLGIEPAFVIGSMYAYEWEEQSFVRSATVWEPYNRGEGKVLRIRERTGGSPILAFGNSTGDRHVLEATARAETHLVLLLDHDDVEREFEYHSERMLELARERGWEIVSMKRDFAELFQDSCLPPG